MCLFNFQAAINQNENNMSKKFFILYFHVLVFHFLRSFSIDFDRKREVKFLSVSFSKKFISFSIFFNLKCKEVLKVFFFQIKNDMPRCSHTTSNQRVTWPAFGIRLSLNLHSNLVSLIYEKMKHAKKMIYEDSIIQLFCFYVH